jgi:hypothetical protein
MLSFSIFFLVVESPWIDV